MGRGRCSRTPLALAEAVYWLQQILEPIHIELRGRDLHTRARRVQRLRHCRQDDPPQVVCLPGAGLSICERTAALAVEREFDQRCPHRRVHGAIIGAVEDVVVLAEGGCAPPALM
jgi:hypothetical protein